MSAFPYLEDAAENEVMSAAIAFLDTDQSWSDFHSSVKDFYAERGYITMAQAQALVKMKNKLGAKNKQRRGQENIGGNLIQLKMRLDAAGETLKYPRVVFRVGDTDFHMYPAGPRSKFQGWIQIKTGCNKWIGRVNPETGELHGRMGPGVLAALKEFGEDPVKAAKAYASLTGNCCFCNRELTDPRSMSNGYGPVCAGHYNLPWGVINYEDHNQ